jgi:O-antigen/teichoic acid export membrane protein
MNAQRSTGLPARLREIWQRNADLLRNAGSLAATTGLTSVFGAVFWVIAAREFSNSAVGYGAAATNAIQLFGTIGMFGLGTMLIGELPKRRERGGLFAASLLASGAGSLVLGIGFAVVVELFFRKNFPEVAGSPAFVLLFVVGVMLTGATLVFDEGTIGLLRGGVQLWRNLAMSALKLVALPATAVVMHDAFGQGITMSFVIGTAVSMVPAAIMLVRGGSRIWHRPDWPLLRGLFKTALNHNWLNLAIATPPRLVPVIVTVAVGPKENAVFFVAYMITSFLFMVPIHLSTVLFAIASASPELIAEKLRFVLRISLMIGLPVMAVLAVGAHFALNIYGPYYAQVGTIPLWLLIIGYIPQMPKAQYIAVSRATNQVGRAAGLLCGAALCEVAAIAIGGKLGGLDGLSFAYLAVLTVEGVVTAPTVLRAAYARTAAATGAFPAVPADAAAADAVRAAASPLARVTGELVRLTGAFTELPGGRAETGAHSGLAALFALASAAVSDEHTLDVATEVWRTGAFPLVPGGATGPRPRPTDLTTLDLLGGQSAAGVAPARLSYRHRQQAGIDALMAIATPVTRETEREEPAERTR